MKDWSDLEDKYQEMRDKDPSAAEDFKKKMTERFQKTVQALEEESQAEKRQIQAMHQQVGSQQLPQVQEFGKHFRSHYVTQRLAISVINLKLACKLNWRQLFNCLAVVNF